MLIFWLCGYTANILTYRTVVLAANLPIFPVVSASPCSHINIHIIIHSITTPRDAKRTSLLQVNPGVKQNKEPQI